MKIIISPAKKMKEDTDWMCAGRLPALLEDTEALLAFMRALSFEEARELWRCNEKIARLNYRRVQEMELRSGYTPALLAYEGLQYQSMAPAVFERGQWEYAEEHLRILSGFYGILRPGDGVCPYRLEMQARARFPRGGQVYQDLYAFWGERLYRELTATDDLILNLASREYSRAVEPYVRGPVRMVTCVFGRLEEAGGRPKIRVKATEAKMARGEMVRFLAGRRVEGPEGVKAFDVSGYRFAPEHSTEERYVFLKT